MDEHVHQDVLADANILPGGSYSVREIEEALTQGLGGQAFLNCERGNKLVEVLPLLFMLSLFSTGVSLSSATANLSSYNCCLLACRFCSA